MSGTAGAAPRRRSWQRGLVDGVCYRLVVEGELSERYSTVFEGMSMEHHEGNTVIVGTVVDQARLQGMLDRIAGLGLRLVSLTPENGT